MSFLDLLVLIPIITGAGLPVCFSAAVYPMIMGSTLLCSPVASLCKNNKSQPTPDLQRRSAFNISYSLTSRLNYCLR